MSELTKSQYLGLEKESLKMEIKVKYFPGQDKKIQFIDKGDWIDVYANEDVFIPKGEMRLVPLGFAMELPENYEAILAPRSSTFKTWGVVQTNSFGVIDESYKGDGDQWLIPFFCLDAKEQLSIETQFEKPIVITGAYIRKGDKIAQFRIQEKMPRKLITITEVETLGNEDRDGFGHTGSR